MITEDYPRTIPVHQIRDTWIYISNSQDAAAIREDLTPAALATVEREDIRAYFIDQEDADRRAIYGIPGNVAYTWKTAIRLMPDPVEDVDYPYTLRRDGEAIDSFSTLDAALMFLLTYQSSSTYHAIKYEGYSITLDGRTVEGLDQ